ncbi:MULTISPECIES: hypothetical protein [unclassified Thermococcus]|nr:MULTISPECIES: hypothetical protein [unclassified Thermococcus]
MLVEGDIYERHGRIKGLSVNLGVTILYSGLGGENTVKAVA